MTQEFKVDVSGIRTPPRAYHNCTVKTIDTSNNLAEVELPGSDGQRITVGLQGTLDLAVNDVVRVWTSPDFPVGWIDGESPNVPGQAAKVSALYNPGLSSIIASIDASDILNIAGLFATNGRQVIQQLSSATAATHTFSLADLRNGITGTANWGLIYFAVGFKVDTTSANANAASSFGMFLKPQGTGVLNEISNAKGAGVTTFSVALDGSGNLEFTTDSDLEMQLFTIALGGNTAV